MEPKWIKQYANNLLEILRHFLTYGFKRPKKIQANLFYNQVNEDENVTNVPVEHPWDLIVKYHLKSQVSVKFINSCDLRGGEESEPEAEKDKKLLEWLVLSINEKILYTVID